MGEKTMVLCVDVGNSFVKYALVSRRRCVSLGGQETARAASRRWSAEIRRRAHQLAAVEGVIVSSVVPSLNQRLSHQLRYLTDQAPVFVDHRIVFPFKLRVKRPGDLGIDRVCAAAGAVRHGARSVIVVDAGSAITVDLVAGGRYYGGLILAGPALTLRALATFTEKLPTIDAHRIDGGHVGFQGTRNSMITGASVGAAGAIREAVRVLQKPLTHRPRKYITGGGAAALKSRLPGSWRFDPNLVHRGLYHLWRMNFADL